MASFFALFFALMFALATCDAGIGLPPGSIPGEGPVVRGDAAVTGVGGLPGEDRPLSRRKAGH